MQLFDYTQKNKTKNNGIMIKRGFQRKGGNTG